MIHIDDEPCFRSDEQFAVLERIASDDNARRELLWLRAVEQDDLDAVLDLERVDPGLLDRLRPVLEEFAAAGALTPAERRAWFAERWRACYERHARELASACACGRCFAERGA